MARSVAESRKAGRFLSLVLFMFLFATVMQTPQCVRLRGGGSGQDGIDPSLPLQQPPVAQVVAGESVIRQDVAVYQQPPSVVSGNHALSGRSVVELSQASHLFLLHFVSVSVLLASCS